MMKDIFDYSTVGPDETPQVSTGQIPATHQWHSPVSFPKSPNTNGSCMHAHPWSLQLKGQWDKTSKYIDSVCMGQPSHNIDYHDANHTPGESSVKAVYSNSLEAIDDIIMQTPLFGTRPKTDHYGEWHATFSWGEGSKCIRMTCATGSPFIIIENPSRQTITCTFAEPFQVNDAFLSVNIHNRAYLIGVSDRKNQQHTDNTWITNASVISLIALPHKPSSELIQTLKEAAFQKITQTDSQPAQINGSIHTTFSQKTIPLHGKATSGVMGLYPHMYDNNSELTTKLTDGYYPNIRGPMRLIVGDHFITQHTIPPLLSDLPMGHPSQKSMTSTRKALSDELAKMIVKKGLMTEAQDTYFLGKALLRACELVRIASMLNHHEAQITILGFIEQELEQWLGATSHKSLHYNPTWGVIVGTPASFGSDKELNDLHFHFGYFIQAAATIAQHNPEWKTRWQPSIDLLCKNLINYDLDPQLMQIPFRVFRAYSGFSQASGHSCFADGGNHESSSEAVQAWTGMMMWADASHNQELYLRSLQAYATECATIRSYVFHHQKPQLGIPGNYQEHCVGMLWDNKIDFSTWFSGELRAILGIQLLPITSRSLYLAFDPHFINIILADYGPKMEGWHDIIRMYQVLGNGQAQALPETLEEGNSQAYFLYWQHTLSQLGILQSDIYALNHDFCAVFKKEDTLTYVVNNHSEEDKQLIFSNGTELFSPAKTHTIKADGQETIYKKIDIIAPRKTLPESSHGAAEEPQQPSLFTPTTTQQTPEVTSSAAHEVIIPSTTDNHTHEKTHVMTIDLTPDETADKHFCIPIDAGQNVGVGTEITIITKDHNGDTIHEKTYPYFASNDLAGWELFQTQNQPATIQLGGGDPENARKIEILAKCVIGQASSKINISGISWTQQSKPVAAGSKTPKP
ncbi:MAG: glycosyl hydrolase [Pseudomonadota bacterium]|nr:glycosyl hydrolase [Pseudomonadota bacterium]